MPCPLLSHLTFPWSLGGRVYYYLPHFSDEEIEATTLLISGQETQHAACIHLVWAFIVTDEIIFKDITLA